MMTLDIIDSGSKANGYVLHNESEAIIIECGCPLLECEKKIGFNLSKIKGVLISHEHGDHARYAKQYSRSALKIYATKGTLTKIGIDGYPMERLMSYRIGNFRVMPFQTEHDAIEPCGFLIDCPDGNRIVFATDTAYLRYTFPKVNYFMLECNYSKEILKMNVNNGNVLDSVAKRITKAHMSLDRCLKTLESNDLRGVKLIILLHLSRDNSLGKEDIIRRIEKETGKIVVIAEKNKTFCIL